MDYLFYLTKTNSVEMLKKTGSLFYNIIIQMCFTDATQISEISSLLLD